VAKHRLGLLSRARDALQAQCPDHSLITTIERELAKASNGNDTPN
jgi:hypothetical protein